MIDRNPSAASTFSYTDASKKSTGSPQPCRCTVNWRLDGMLDPTIPVLAALCRGSAWEEAMKELCETRHHVAATNDAQHAFRHAAPRCCVTRDISYCFLLKIP
mmetsp:Transcript_60170/g.135406  ORF Transcript_60170/g.135406 Transcript_60170/m.135406 type:complete len:103 (+) Transcript_60170:710-1018(+)